MSEKKHDPVTNEESRASDVHKAAWVVAKRRTDYGCLDYFSGEWSSVGYGRPVFGYFPETAKKHETLADAHATIRDLEKHRRVHPNCWHYAKSQGGYGLETMQALTFEEAVQDYEQSELGQRYWKRALERNK